MKQKVALIMAGIVLAATAALMRYGEQREEKLRLNSERCADEANAMLAAFLSTNRPAADKGAFLKATGSGHQTPGPWNLEGQFYLSMQRHAHYQRGVETLQVTMYPGAETKVWRHPEHPAVYMTHPDLKGK